MFCFRYIRSVVSCYAHQGNTGYCFDHQFDYFICDFAYINCIVIYIEIRKFVCIQCASSYVVVACRHEYTCRCSVFYA